jgi:Spy/CpxP family protein refolding chaperone
MKRLMTSVLLSASLLTGAAAYAGPGYGHHDGKDHVQHLAKKLDLTDEQKAAIEEIHRAHGGMDKKAKKQHRRELMRSFTELDPASADYSARVAELAREEGEKVEQAIIKRGEIHAKVYEVLTPEQREKFKTMKTKHKNRTTVDD